jgi:serine/threonine-protein kinase PknG
MSTTATCPSCGTSSTEMDFCSDCGASMTAAPPPPPAVRPADPSAGGLFVGSTTGRTGRGATLTSRSARSGRATTTARSGKVRGLISTRSTRSTRSSRRLGSAGIVPLPPLPKMLPRERIATEPEIGPDKKPTGRRLLVTVVPPNKRRCGGLKEDGTPCETRLTRIDGYCSMCGSSYNFRAGLAPALVTEPDGEPAYDDEGWPKTIPQVIDGTYEIVGPMAYGGLGWVYLAHDSSLNRWCVMKGLINSSDPAMIAMARNEAQFLASLSHPNIVQVYSFLRHGTEGYINMELVNGKNLLQIRKENNGPLPVPLAISYILNILPAFAYLDRRGLIYMDMKLENVMVVDDGQGNTISKLIDLGAVRRADDKEGDLFATIGYAAPEVSADPAYPTPVSDLFSIGRTLALLVCDFDYTSQKYEFVLPTPGEAPVFAEHESLYRWLTKMTAEAPDARFQTADEAAQQLLGVLHEELVGGAVEEHLGSYQSALFDTDAPPGRDLWDPEEGKSVRALPMLRVDISDPGATAALASATIADPMRRMDAYESTLMTLKGAKPNRRRRKKGDPADPADPTAPQATTGRTSLELLLRIADTSISQRMFDRAFQRIAEAEKAEQFDWRVAWYRGKALVAQGKVSEALTHFDYVFGEVPGEAASKLALALCYEMMTNYADAVVYYDSVLRSDVHLTAASFGLGRSHLALGDRAAAVAALEQIPGTSSRFSQGQLALARVLISDVQGNPPEAEHLERASDVVKGLMSVLEGIPLHETATEVYLAAVRSLRAGVPLVMTSAPILDAQIHSHKSDTERALRSGAEKELRICAQYAKTRDERVAYVDRANAVAPRRWW